MGSIREMDYSKPNDGFPVFSTDYKEGFQAGRNAQRLINEGEIVVLRSQLSALEEEIYYLRLYGNKDCTAMADEVRGNKERACISTEVASS